MSGILNCRAAGSSLNFVSPHVSSITSMSATSYMEKASLISLLVIQIGIEVLLYVYGFKIQVTTEFCFV